MSERVRQLETERSQRSAVSSPFRCGVSLVDVSAVKGSASAQKLEQTNESYFESVLHETKGREGIESIAKKTCAEAKGRGGGGVN